MFTFELDEPKRCKRAYWWIDIILRWYRVEWTAQYTTDMWLEPIENESKPVLKLVK